MKTKVLIIGPLVGLFFISALATTGQEAVNGYYDSKNDWFVFEWVNPQTGKQRAIYDSASKIKPVMHASISFDAGSGLFKYSYQVSNLPGAVQTLHDISLKHPALVLEPTSPSPASDWISTEYHGKGAWSWTNMARPNRGILGGQTVSGFSFKSKGLPALVGDWFTGERREKFRIPSPDYDTEEVQASFNKVFNNLKAQYPDKFVNAVQQVTVGPIDPPATLNAASFIQNLIALVNQSKSQGWIDNDGIVTSLLAKLNNALAKANTGDTQTVKSVLGAFVSEVSAQNGKHLTSEAYALLYFNGKYLVDHL